MIKNLLFKITRENTLFAELSMTALRVFFGVTMAMAHGFKKTPPSPEFINNVSNMGFPFPVFFAWSASLAEFLGGALIAIGLLTRPSAVFVGITMIIAAFGAHAADPFKVKELSLTYLMIAIVFAVRGAGRYSLDKVANSK